MRKIIFITVAILTFALGVLISFIAHPSGWEHSDIPPISKSVEDEWHCLFEAAYMAKDDELRDEVLARLQCMTTDGALAGRLMFDEEGAHCVEGLGISKADGERYSMLIKAHGDWAKKNMPFIRSIANPLAARRYVREQLTNKGPVILQ